MNQTNILSGLNPAQYKDIRKLIIEMILATDLAGHMQIMGEPNIIILIFFPAQKPSIALVLDTWPTLLTTILTARKHHITHAKCKMVLFIYNFSQVWERNYVGIQLRKQGGEGVGMVGWLERYDNGLMCGIPF